MFDEALKKVFDLAKKSGDRLIVYDRETQDAFVVMDLDAYQTLLKRQHLNANSHKIKNLESEISKDLALWERTKQEVKSGRLSEHPEGKPAEAGETPLPIIDNSEEKYYFEAVEDESEKES